MDFSVIIATYNATKKQLKMTIDSVLNQKDIEYEIIVCDDASADNHFEWIKEYLDGAAFSEYTLLGGDKNLGTVRNMLRGIRLAKGEYSKLIGAGDMLYKDTTLHDIKQFMEAENTSCCFGLMQGFQIKDSERIKVTHTSPRVISVYRNKERKKIVRNILVSEDWVSGAGIFAKTFYYLKYISMLEDKVIYCEDWATALALVDDVYLKLYDDYAIWYEVGEGVSTTPSPSWRKKLLHDNEEFWKIFEKYAAESNNNSFARENKLRRRKKKADKLGGKYFGTLLKAISNPGLLAFEFKARCQEKKR